MTVTNLSQRFTHKMAAKTSWYRYGTKLRHCHPIYKRIDIVLTTKPTTFTVNLKPKFSDRCWRSRHKTDKTGSYF